MRGSKSGGRGERGAAASHGSGGGGDGYREERKIGSGTMLVWAKVSVYSSNPRVGYVHTYMDLLQRPHTLTDPICLKGSIG